MDLTVQNQINQLMAVLLPLGLALIAWISRYVTLWIKAKTAAQTLKLTQSQLDVLRIIVVDGVKMAEQTGLKSKIEMTGKQLKDMAVAWVQNQADLHGIPADVSTIEGLIESSLLDGVHKALVPSASDTLKTDVTVGGTPDAPTLSVSTQSTSTDVPAAPAVPTAAQPDVPAQG